MGSNHRLFPIIYVCHNPDSTYSVNDNSDAVQENCRNLFFQTLDERNSEPHGSKTENGSHHIECDSVGII